MTRLFTEGFEEGWIESKWDYISDDSPNSMHVFWGKHQYDSSFGNIYPRSGNAAFFIGNSPSIRKDFSSNPTEVFGGFAFFPTAADGGSSFFELHTTLDSAIVGLRISQTTELKAYRGGTNIATASSLGSLINAWHYIEYRLLPRNSDGVFRILLDGSEIMNFSGDTTDSNEYVVALKFYGRNRIFYDDIVLNDANGSYNNTYPGQVRLLPIFTAGSGASTQWSRAGFDTGSNHGQLMRPDGYGFSVTQTASADQIDLFDVGAPDLPAGATIKNIIVNVAARRDSGSGTVAAGVRGGTTNEFGSDTALTSTPKIIQYAAPINPADSAAWEEADLADLQIGYTS